MQLSQMVKQETELADVVLNHTETMLKSIPLMNSFSGIWQSRDCN